MSTIEVNVLNWKYSGINLKAALLLAAAAIWMHFQGDLSRWISYWAGKKTPEILANGDFVAILPSSLINSVPFSAHQCYDTTCAISLVPRTAEVWILTWGPPNCKTASKCGKVHDKDIATFSYCGSEDFIAMMQNYIKIWLWLCKRKAPKPNKNIQCRVVV